MFSTNFDDSKLLDSATLDAQRKEKERLERLEKIEQSISNTDHIQQVAALQPLPVIDLTDNDFVSANSIFLLESYRFLMIFVHLYWKKWELSLINLRSSMCRVTTMIFRKLDL